MRVVHRGRHGDKNVVGIAQLGRIAGVFGMRGERHVGPTDLARRVNARAAAHDLVLEDVKADRSAELAEFDDEGKAHVAQTNDSDNAHINSPRTGADEGSAGDPIVDGSKVFRTPPARLAILGRENPSSTFADDGGSRESTRTGQPSQYGARNASVPFFIVSLLASPDAIQAFASDRSRVRKMGSEARRMALSRFESSQTAATMLTLYREVQARWQRRGRRR